MKIAVDAMGGDHAPEAPVEGSLLAMPRCPAQLLLIGHESRVREVLGDRREGSSLEIVHAPEAVGMEEPGPVALRRKRASSLSVAMKLLADREVDAVVSAGNTSAVVAAAKHWVGLVPGLRRPAMAVPVPVPTGRVLLVDAGAQAEAHTIHLAQSAALAHVYLQVAGGPVHPRVGLVNIGREPGKGLKVIRRTFAVLQRSSLRFIGNVEPQGLFADQIDIAVCDGFVGNLLLKMYEGICETFLQFLQSRLEAGADRSQGELREALENFEGTYLYHNVGGAPLLGARRTVVAAHGRSRATAIANAVLVAYRLVRDGVFERTAEALEKTGILHEMKHLNTVLLLESLRKQVGLPARNG